jgi:hypothetical protein
VLRKHDEQIALKLAQGKAEGSFDTMAIRLEDSLSVRRTTQLAVVHPDCLRRADNAPREDERPQHG